VIRPDPPHDPLPAVSLPLDEKEFKDAGAKDGASNLPAFTAPGPTHAEQKAIDACEAEAQRLLARAKGEVADTLAQATRLSHVPDETEFAALEANSMARVDLALQAARPKLKSAQAQYLKHLAIWNGFRYTNRLQRAPKPRANRSLLIALLILLMVLEAIVNATFLAEGSSLGLIGGFATAIFVSLISVMAGFMTGKFATPRLQHISQRERRAAWFAIAVWAIVVLGLQLFFAHYRDLVEQQDLQAHIHALRHTRLHPLTLTFKGYALFLLGALFSLVAYLDGGHWDDPYLEYGDVSRDLEEAKTQFEAVRHAIDNEVRSIVESVREALVALRRAAEENAATLVRLSEGIPALRTSYDSKLDLLSDRCRQLLLAYRDTNTTVRTTSPPAYFSVFPPFSYPLDLTPLQALPVMAKRLQDALPQVRKLEAAAHAREPDRLGDSLRKLKAYWDDVSAEAHADPQVLAFTSSPSPSPPEPTV